MRVFFQDHPHCVQVISSEGTLLDINQAGLALLEAENPAQVVGKNIYEVIAPEFRQVFGEMLRGEADGGRAPLELEIVGLEGTRRWMEMHMTRVPDGEGGPQVRLAVMRDITSRKRTEAALRESEAGLQAEVADLKLLQALSTELVSQQNVEAIYERILDAGVAIMRSDFGSMQMFHPARGNGGELRLLASRGFSAQAMKFWKWVRPNSASTCGQAMATRGRVIVPDVEQSPELAGSEDLVTYRETGIRAVQSTPLFSRDGKLVGMLSTHWRGVHQPAERELRLLDIVAREAADLVERRQAEDALRESELRWRTMADALPNLLWTDLPDGQCDWLSSQWGKYTGIPEKELLGLNWLARVIHPEDRERTMACWRAACEDRGDYDLEHRIRRHDGQYRWFKTRGVPVRDRRGKIIYWFGTCTDIEDLKRAERREHALMERTLTATAKFEAVFNQSGIFAGIVDLQGYLREVNDLAVHACGYSREEVLDRRYWETAWWRGSEEIRAQVRTATEHARSGRVFREVLRYWLSDGTERIVDFSMHPIRDKSGAVRFLHPTGIDITERKLSEEALRRQKDRAALVAEILKGLLAPKDAESVMRDLLPRIAEHFRAGVFFNFVPAEDGSALRLQACGGIPEESAGKLLRLETGQGICGRVAATRRSIHLTDLQNSADEEVGFLRSLGVQAYYCSPLMVGDKFLGTLAFGSRSRTRFEPEELEFLTTVVQFVAIALDRLCTEEALRSSEERFRTLADSIANLAWRANPAGEVTWFNRRWYEYTGTTPAEVEGWGWKKVHDPEMLPEVLERWKASLATGEPFEMEFPLRGADGNFRWFLTRGLPLRDTSGKVTQWFGTHTDVTEQKDAQFILARSNEQLEKMVADRTEKLQELIGELEHFSYTITHDLRSPLRAMNAFAQELKERGAQRLTKEDLEFADHIITGAARMDALILGALSYSKAVRQELPLAGIDLEALLRGMLDTYPEFQRNKGQITLEPGIPRVLGNEAALTQCFSNLLGNALKFVPPEKSAEVRVRAEIMRTPHFKVHSQKPGAAASESLRSMSNSRESEAGARVEWVRIWVEDNGIGMSPNLLPRLFEMFSRGPGPQSGTGIGLALVRKVVHRMGGKVGVESELGKGSRFWVQLQRAPTAGS